MEKFLRLPAVKAQVGYSKSKIYELVSAGEFPKPIKLDSRTSVWIESEIENWISNRINASRGAA